MFYAVIKVDGSEWKYKCKIPNASTVREAPPRTGVPPWSRWPVRLRDRCGICGRGASDHDESAAASALGEDTF
jgi:hypothetical protein